MKYPLTDTIAELLGVPVKEASQNTMVPCPAHDGWNDATPSLSINLISGLWLCHQCGEKGNLNRLARLVGEEIGDEIRWAQAQAKAVFEPTVEPDFTNMAQMHYDTLWTTRGAAAGNSTLYNYAKAKGVSVEDLRTHFRVGWNREKSALSFPYYNDDKVIGIRYRAANGFKWFEEGSKRSLYNVNEVRGAGTVLVCEGESDTQSARGPAATVGVRVCGSPGAGVSEGTWRLWVLDLLFARRIFIGFDNDNAGNKGAEIAMRVLGSHRTSQVSLPDGVDISEFLANGGNLVERLEE